VRRADHLAIIVAVTTVPLHALLLWRAAGVADDHQPLAVEAVDDGAGRQLEQQVRQGAEKADDAGVGGRAGQRPHQQRIGGRADAGADGQRRQADPEKGEVAVIAQPPGVVRRLLGSAPVRLSAGPSADGAKPAHLSAADGDSAGHTGA
jgi:hypothetical protein